MNLCVCVCVCVCVWYRNPHRWTNPQQISNGGLTLQGPGHRLCFGSGVENWLEESLRSIIFRSLSFWFFFQFYVLDTDYVWVFNPNFRISSGFLIFDLDCTFFNLDSDFEPDWHLDLFSNFCVRFRFQIRIQIWFICSSYFYSWI